jgi:hypothetical protein
VPVAVAEILVRVELVRLGRVVAGRAAFEWIVGREDRRALVEGERAVALETDRVAQVRARGE